MGLESASGAIGPLINITLGKATGRGRNILFESQCGSFVIQEFNARRCEVSAGLVGEGAGLALVCDRQQQPFIGLGGGRPGNGCSNEKGSAQYKGQHI